MSSGYIVALAVGVCVVLGLSTFTAGRQSEKPESGFRPLRVEFRVSNF